MGKPIPKAQVMRFLKSKEYSDAKDFAGECESVVVVAKGQSKHTNYYFLLFNNIDSLLNVYGELRNVVHARRCTRDMQVRDTGGLHSGFLGFPVPIRAGFVFGLVL